VAGAAGRWSPSTPLVALVAIFGKGEIVSCGSGSRVTSHVEHEGGAEDLAAVACATAL